MADWLVRLYDLEKHRAACPPPQDYRLRRAMSYETTTVVEWVAAQFGRPWADQAAAALVHRTPGCLIATQAGAIAGFVCWDATARGFFGPLGVAPAHRGRGVGHALTWQALEAMRAAGYGYAVIGGVGDPRIYRQAAGAFEIPGSGSGLYADRLA